MENQSEIMGNKNIKPDLICEEEKSEKPIWRRFTAGTGAGPSEVSCTHKQGRGICSLQLPRSHQQDQREGKGKTSNTIRISCSSNTVPNQYGTANDVPLEL